MRYWRPVRALLSTSAGSMGLDVPKTNLVVINGSPSTTWELSQQVNHICCSNWHFTPEHSFHFKIRFKFGRAGRGGNSAMCIYLRRKGERTPAEIRPYLTSDSSICLKKGLVKIFTLSNPDGIVYCNMTGLDNMEYIFNFFSVTYPNEEELVNCGQACLDIGRCQCSKCRYILF